MKQLARLQGGYRVSRDQSWAAAHVKIEPADLLAKHIVIKAIAVVCDEHHFACDACRPLQEGHHLGRPQLREERQPCIANDSLVAAMLSKESCSCGFHLVPTELGSAAQKQRLAGCQVHRSQLDDLTSRFPSPLVPGFMPVHGSIATMDVVMDALQVQSHQAEAQLARIKSGLHDRQQPNRNSPRD